MTQNDNFPAYIDIIEEAKAELRKFRLEELAGAGILQPVENYYLIANYPPLKALGEAKSREFLPLVSERCSIYVHIPFCDQRCTFCHFAKEVLPNQERVEHYMAALGREMELVTGITGRLTAKTVYIGGGTPSYLLAEQITSLFEMLRKAVSLPSDTEISFELHPSVVEAPDHEDRLDALAASGVNRWCFGVQSMDDQILRKLNRGHTAADVHRLLELLANRNVDNLSVDLIFGLPYQTTESWYTTIRQLIEAGVDKFNIVPLMFKQADPISAQYRANPEIFPNNEGRLLMHFATEAIMKRLGYRRGPLFYYAKADSHSRQQEDKYDSIEDINLLPFGVSGFGYVGNTQYYNECTLDGYMSAIKEGRPPVWRGTRLDLDERMRRTIIFALKSSGVDRAAFAERYGVDPLEQFRSELAPFLDRGLVSASDTRLSVTDRGAPFADSIALHLVSDRVRERVQLANSRNTDLKRDTLDRYDFSPIERDPVAATVSPLPVPEVPPRHA